MSRGRILFPLVVLISLFVTGKARADYSEDFAHAVESLKAGRAGAAIAEFESLADRGFVDPHASYDRGLAYVTRVRIGGEEPGDLGRAAHGFEEARELGSSDLADDAETALTAVRAEIARRRARSGLRSPVSERPPLGDTIVHLLPIRVAAIASLLSSFLFAIGLIGRFSGRFHGRIRATSTAILLVSGPLLVLGATLASLTVRDRATREEFVIVTSSTYPSNEQGIAIPGLDPLPEGGRVRLLRGRASDIEIEWQGKRVWVQRGALRPLVLRKT